MFLSHIQLVTKCHQLTLLMITFILHANYKVYLAGFQLADIYD
jgi:hypothetical protein